VRFAPLASLKEDAERNRIVGMEAHLAETFGDRAKGAGTVSQKTLRGLLATPGVDVVLVGMRTASYVRDVLGAF
jgi:aryl-alcohol dehydrogenase-like predicted oxidoreductase